MDPKPRDCTHADVAAEFARPLLDLLCDAQRIHRENFKANGIQIAKLLNIKTAGCPENCSYCPQSAHYKTGVERENLWPIDEVLAEAQQAKRLGATRFCIAGAWRSPPANMIPKLVDILLAIKELGLETCATFGMLTQEQAHQLKAGNLDYYNHNIDTSPEFYPQIISTHTFEDRLQTLEFVRKAGLKVCCGGILGLGESREDRIEFIRQFLIMPEPPLSIPINLLIPISGTPLEKKQIIDPLEFVRTIAVARILLPNSVIRLSGNRKTMSTTWQTLCFMAGANSMFIGEKLLVTPNTPIEDDMKMLEDIGLEASHQVAF
jgi:biotin synthase